MTRPQIAQPIPPPAPKALPAARLRWLVPSLLALLYVMQCAWFIRTQSLTYDEPVHIAEGLNAWRYGRFEQYNDHPPLARLWCALPLIGPKWQVEIQQLPDSFRVTRIAPDPVSLAWRARAMNVLLGLALAGLVWWAADRLFSRTAANFALALFAFSPSLIAHFSIAATDGAATLFIFATAWSLVRWRREPSWQKTLGLGLLLGLMLLAKFSTAPMFVLALLWVLLPGADRVISSPLKCFDWPGHCCEKKSTRPTRTVDHGAVSRALHGDGAFCPLQPGRAPRVARISLCFLVCGGGVGMGPP